MRIAVICKPAVASWGGSEELWAAMADQALADGLEVIISPRLDTYHEPVRLRELQKKGATVFETPSCLTSQANADEPAIMGYYRQVLTPKPDLIFVNDGGIYDELFTPALLNAIYETGVPYVIMFNLVAEAGLIDEDKRLNAKQFLLGASKLIFVSMANWLLTQRHVAASLPNGIILQYPANLQDTSPVSWPAGETFCMASVARIEPVQKGHDMLFEALHSPEWRNRNWKLRVYGEGIRRPYLEDLAVYYDIDAKVEFAGFQPDVRSIWANNHLLVVPSRYEGVPIVLMEAMLCGRAVMATKVGATNDWIQNNVTGFIAEMPGVEYISNALERAWQARDSLQQMGLAAHEAAIKKYDKNAGRTLLNVLSSLVQ